MKIRTRALFVVMLVVSVIGVTALLVAWNVASSGVAKREELEMKDALARVGTAMSIQVEQLERTSKDWSIWDDMYRFARDRNEQFAAGNLFPSALETIDVNYLRIIDAQGRTIATVSADTSGSAKPNAPPAVDAILAARPEIRARGAVGLVSTSRGTLMVSIQPILRSDSTGPSAGTLVMGRYLGRSDSQRLSRITGDSVSFLATRTADAELRSDPAWTSSAARLEGVVVPTDRDTIVGYREVLGLDGDPVLVVSDSRPRTTAIMARETGGYLLTAVFIASLALMLGVAGAVDTIVTRRLTRLSETVRSITSEGDFSRRVDASGADEISTLGTDINSMLTTLNDSQLELEYMAGHDMLTTLFNRRRFEEELERDLKERVRTGGQGAILWLDIDNFKGINDSLGHAVGDRLLRDFSAEVKRETRAYATLSRIGGDEFALILPAADRTEAEKAAQRLIELLRTHVFEIDGHLITQRISIGIALYPDHGATTDELLVCADLAMYQAKNAGGDGYRVFEYAADTSVEPSV